MQTLQLSVNPEGWRLFQSRKNNATFKKIREKIFERDQHSCQFCGFQARDYQEVVNLDQNYRHNTLSNMATACCFCTQCLFLENIGVGDYGGGKLIYLPEMTQVELNSFCHVIFCAMTNGTSYQETSQSIYRSLKFRMQPVEEKYGVGTSSPAVFAQMIIESQEKEDNNKEIVEQIFKDIRVLPSYAKFKKQLDHWAIAAAEELSGDQEIE